MLRLISGKSQRRISDDQMRVCSFSHLCMSVDNTNSWWKTRLLLSCSCFIQRVDLTRSQITRQISTFKQRFSNWSYAERFQGGVCGLEEAVLSGFGLY